MYHAKVLQLSSQFKLGSLSRIKAVQRQCFKEHFQMDKDNLTIKIIKKIGLI